MPGCSPGVTPHCPVGERVFSTPPFQASKFVGCSWPPLPGHFQLELQLRFDISELSLRAWLEHSARHPRCSGIPLSIHFPKSTGFGACCAVWGGGLGAPGACRHRAAILAFPVGDAAGAQFSPRLCNARVHRRFSLARGPSLPGLTASPSPSMGGKGQPRHRFVSSRAQRAGCSGTSGQLVSSAWSTVPKKSLERAMGNSLH